MRTTKLAFILIIITTFFVNLSCVTKKQLTYLDYISEFDRSILETGLSEEVPPIVYKIMPYDILYIRILTPDPKWSEVFNLVQSGGGASMTMEGAALSGYTVDPYGFVELPFVGKLKVVDKTLHEVKLKLDSTYNNYVKDASIIVNLVNNYVSIIGEVMAPGRYPLTKYQLNIFEALSMAGDLSAYSNRQKVQLIRQTQSGPIIKEFSLKDRGILTSDSYFVMPNDIIYAPPLKARTFQINSASYSLILSSIATILTSVTTLLLLFGYDPYGNN